MRYLIALALRSAWNRRYTLSFTLLSIALATTLLVGVERLRHDVRESFSQSVSGTDLVVGARSSPVDAPVSYTHLDVYKRQINWCWRRTSPSPCRAVPGCGWCANSLS